MQINMMLILWGLISVAVGFIAYFINSRRVGQLQSLLQQAEQNLHESTKREDVWVVQEKQLEKELNQLSIDQRVQFERLSAVQHNLQQAEARFAALQQQEKSLQAQLKESIGLQHENAKQLEATLAQNKSLLGQLAEAKESNRRLEQRISDLQEELKQVNKEHAELSTSLNSKEQHFKEQLAQLNEAKKVLTQEFENIANKVFEEKNKTFTQTSQTNIDQLLKPFREQIEAFQKRSNEVHDASLKGQTQLEAEIKKVLEVGMKMGEDAKNLTTALKGDSQQRGAWGEAQLERTLQMSGLIENAHYEAQSAFTDDQGRTKRTDYLIKLPDGKHLIIDSKVTLNAYARVVEADSSEAYQLAMKEHCQAVRRHIDDLKSKDYSALAGIRSPDYVLMFMPIEAAYIEALKFDGGLFEYGYDRNVILVSHTTLIPILRTVANLWRLDNSSREAQKLSEHAGDIFNQVCIVAERLQSLGKTLSAASNHYNNTVTALAGQQGLYGKVSRFNQLSNKEFPQLETRHIDIDAHRLNLIVEPIESVNNLVIDNEQNPEE